MSHRIIIIQSQTPPAPNAAAADVVPEYKVSVEYRPNDALTASQIGNEVARIQKCVNKIIEGTPD